MASCRSLAYYVGIDGGGTKTQYILVDENGAVLARRDGGGSSYKEHGAEQVGHMLRREAAALIDSAGVDAVSGIAFGMPCFGESGAEELRDATAAISRILHPWRVSYTNDVEASWAGAFALDGGGITILSGTGSMSITRDASGRTARCGGWSELFSDEGSCYWLGLETMRLFSRQADGRAEKGALYRMIRDVFRLGDDYEVVDIIHRRYAGKRDMTASLQLLLRDAALAGDGACVALYRAAARELVGLILGLVPLFPSGAAIPVSYAGGLFRAGELILGPFAEELRRCPRLRLTRPLLSPIEGAALLAVEAFNPEALPRARAGLLRACSL